MNRLVGVAKGAQAFSEFPELWKSPFIKLPDYEAVINYDLRVIAPLGNLAVGFGDYFSDNKSYPNACMHIAPMPCDQRGSRATFMVAWGDKVDKLPHPRLERMPEYFGALSRIAMKFRNQTYVAHVMDGHGILGRIGVNFLNQVELGIYMGDQQDPEDVIEKWYPELQDMRKTILDITCDLEANNPLRFHSGIKYISRNKYISNIHFPDDQQLAIPLAA